MPRQQSNVVHIAFIAITRMSLSISMHLQCYLKIRFIHCALRSGYATMHNVTIQKTAFFELGENIVVALLAFFKHCHEECTYT